MTNLISVAMTTYNGAQYLAEQIDSILTQNYSDFELIICDDCSTDLTHSILNEYAKRDRRIKLHFNETNLGFKKNFEQALQFCTGEFVAFADQDDVWTKDHLSVLLANIGDKDIACSNSALVDEKLNPLNTDMKTICHFTSIPEDKAELFFYFLFGNNFVQGTASLMKRDFLLKCLPIPEFVIFHDYWFGINAAACNGIFYFEDSTLFYRQHGNNITNNTNSICKKVKDSIVNAKTMKKKPAANLSVCKYFLKCKNTEYDDNILLAEKILLARKHYNLIKFTFLFIKYYKAIFNQQNYKFFISRYFLRILF
ncbi:MAG: glycosyltransferase family 2 protein [Spirochaetaceae bacterium]|nr:glycosyltransferase family 2 protein [Spirochaetaceae bacterium]